MAMMMMMMMTVITMTICLTDRFLDSAQTPFLLFTGRKKVGIVLCFLVIFKCSIIFTSAFNLIDLHFLQVLVVICGIQLTPNP